MDLGAAQRLLQYQQDRPAKMAFDEKSLSEKYATTSLAIQSNTQISSRATAVITALSPAVNPQTDITKPPLVVLRAQSRWSSKLISVAEIAKRDLQAKGVKVFQYSALSSEIVEIERKSKPDGAAELSDDEAFQTMGAHELSDRKKRAVPVLTVYLAAQSVKGLKGAFG